MLTDSDISDTWDLIARRQNNQPDVCRMDCFIPVLRTSVWNIARSQNVIQLWPINLRVRKGWGLADRLCYLSNQQHSELQSLGVGCLLVSGRWRSWKNWWTRGDQWRSSIAVAVVVTRAFRLKVSHSAKLVTSVSMVRQTLYPNLFWELIHLRYLRIILVVYLRLLLKCIH